MSDEKKIDEATAEAAEAQTEQHPADMDAVEAVLDEIHPNLEALVEERDALKDRLMRALADAENTRKRAERDRREAAQYGGSKLARDLLSVYDNITRALDTVDDLSRESAAGLIEGIELTRRDLLASFEKHDIRTVSPEVGDTFDPQMHQAMFEAPIQGTKAGSVIQVMAEGFMIGDRLLRPAQVGVSSAVADAG